MSLDLTLLRVFKYREQYERFKSLVNHRAIDPKTSAILKDFGKWFEQDPDCEVIPVATDFMPFFNLLHPTISDDARALYRAQLEQLSTDASEAATASLTMRLVELDAAQKVTDLITQYSSGAEIDLSIQLKQIVEEVELAKRVKLNIPFIEVGGDLFQDDVDDSGLRWRWDCLNENMRPLRGGDFVILAARPDAGKTTAIADNITFMAPQVAATMPGRTILWLNNEGPGNRIQKRLVQVALGVTTGTAVQMFKDGELWRKYELVMGGLHTVRVVDIHGWASWQVEELLRRIPPALVVFDMIDNIRFEGAVGNGGTRTDQLLEAMYQWARILGCIHNCPIIATSQLPGDAEGMAYPALGMLKDSKTGKQGAADVIITMGQSLADGLESVRFIGQTKNKLNREGTPKSIKRELIMRSDVGRFVEK